MKKAALVFSGGALRGFAQIGAYKAISEFLKKNDARVDTVVGTSFGSITASLIALGYSPEELMQFSLDSGLRLANLRDVKIRGAGLLTPNRVKKELARHVDVKTFADVKPNLIINTVDIASGKEFLFTRKGFVAADKSESVPDKNIRILEAILASCAIPGVFVPRNMYDKILVDGGLVNPIGLGLIDRSKFDYVIGVDVCMANFNFITSKRPRAIHIIQQSVSLAQRQFHFERLEKHLENNPHVYLIRPDVGPINKKNKHEMQRVLNCGYEAAKTSLGL